jgi:hypothetical protein
LIPHPPPTSIYTSYHTFSLPAALPLLCEPPLNFFGVVPLDLSPGWGVVYFYNRSK